MCSWCSAKRNCPAILTPMGRRREKAETGSSDLEQRVKTCAACGRDFEWRRKWARCWAQVRYCSERCRGRGAGTCKVDAELETEILELLSVGNGSICPSEAARKVAERRGLEWRDLMEATRSAARRLAARGQVVVLQRGRPVDPSLARGPIRLAACEKARVHRTSTRRPGNE